MFLFIQNGCEKRLQLNTSLDLKNTLKILYIFLAGVGVFFLNDLFILLGIIAVHLGLYFTIKNPKKSLRFLLKVKWFVLLIFLVHSLTGENDIPLLEIKKWDWVLALSYEGLYLGGVMGCKLIAMLMITQVVRFTMKSNDFVQGLTGLGLSASSAEIIDQIIDIVSSEKKKNAGGKGNGGGGGGNGKGGGKGNRNKGGSDPEEDKATDVLFKGKVGGIPKKLIGRLNFATEKFKNNPNATIASSALAITLIRMVKIAPGLPVAPGHKSILVFPLFINAILKSKKPFAGIQIGSISGILHFSMGFGKYGPLGILEFIIVGGVIDLMLKLPFKKTNLIYLMSIGAVAGITRIGIEILLAYILGISSAFFILFLPYIISQISFGIASGFISRAILKTNNNE